jgi:hypothetical protein
MTLLDAPRFDEKAAKRRRDASIGGLILLGIAVVVYMVLWTAVFHTFDFRTWPAEHRLNVFMKTLEGGDFNQAYAMWNSDPDWQQHPQKYSTYDFNQFQKDWGPGSDYGKIRSHQVLMVKSVGNGTVAGLTINGDTAHPLFMRVDDKTKQIGFSPVELYVGP